MATVRPGSKAAFLVVDAQVGVIQAAWQARRVIENIRLAVEKARRLGVPVIWVQHSDEELLHGSRAWQLVPELPPMHGEMQIDKQHNSAFEETQLEETLEGLGASHIYLAGAATNWCVRATAHAALERGYDLTLIRDAHTTETLELEDGTRIEAADIIRELNIAMTWLRYPGRTNRTASVAQVDFSRA